MHLNSTRKFKEEYENYLKEGGTQRLGQYFINNYGYCTENNQLFYSTNEKECLLLIDTYLKDLQYYEELPRTSMSRCRKM